MILPVFEWVLMVFKRLPLFTMIGDLVTVEHWRVANGNIMKWMRKIYQREIIYFRNEE